MGDLKSIKNKPIKDPNYFNVEELGPFCLIFGQLILCSSRGRVVKASD